MNSEFDAEARRPSDPSDPGGADAPARWQAPVCFDATPGVVTYTYEVREAPGQFSFDHDRAKGLYVVTQPDGTTELFRDNAVRYLVVEPDPQTGELRPAVKYGRCISTCAASSERAENGSARPGSAMAVQAVRRLFNVIRRGSGSRVAVREFRTWGSTPKH